MVTHLEKGRKGLSRHLYGMPWWVILYHGERAQVIEAALIGLLFA